MTDSSWEAKVLLANNPPAEEKEIFSGGEWRTVTTRRDDKTYIVHTLYLDDAARQKFVTWPESSKLEGQELLGVLFTCGACAKDRIAPDGEVIPMQLGISVATGAVLWFCTAMPSERSSDDIIAELNRGVPKGPPLWLRRIDQCEEPSPIRSLGTNRRLLLAGLGLAAAMGFLGGGGAVLITTSTLFLVLGGVLALNKLIESKDAVAQPPSKQSAAPAIKKALKPKNALAPNLARNMLIFTVHVLLDGLKRAAGMGAPSREVLHERMQDGVARQAPRAVRRAVKMGAPVENRITMPDFTGSLVGWSAANGHVPLLEALLKKGASPDSPHDDKPALLQAVAGYHPVAVSRLLAAGTTASVQDALAVAERNGHTDIAKDLSDIAIGHRVVEEIVEGPWRVLECQAAPAFSKAAAAESEAVAELEVSAPSSRRMTL
jgi:hypothetical protein